MTAKERRQLLFRKSRPLARRLSLLEGDKYSKDAGILWAAYKAGSFEISDGLTQEQFMDEMQTAINTFKDIWIVDDDTPAYSTGRGPVGMVCTVVIDMIIEPRFTFFKWATCRNVLKVTVGFINMIRSSVKTGIVLVRANAGKRSVADHMKKYDLLYPLGKSAGDEYLYSIRGRGSNA